ncbi:hypothetical protein AB0L57_02185 [Nocardia sp. NPDC052254]|uniref:hypothetical protein n=1 Tax=Nocardia sp. NPDC052254 TaxID=3155681 RepID=UPI0034499ABD
MTYPPGPGPYGQGPQQPHDGGWGRDPYQPGGGWDAQPTGWEAPSWDQQQPPQQPSWDQSGYGGGYGPPPPPKNNSGLIVGIVFGVIALLVVGIGIAVVATRDSGSKNEAGAGSTPALVPATEETTTATTEPDTTAPDSGTSPHVSYQEYAKNWDFKLGEVELHADWVQGRDHASCSDIEVGGKLTGLGCRYAAEMVYKAENGSLMLTQFIMGMDSAAQAEAAPGQYTDADLKLRPGTYVDHFAVGKWKDDAEKDYLVVTFATATNAVDEETAKKYLKYRHTDTVGALSFR